MNKKKSSPLVSIVFIIGIIAFVTYTTILGNKVEVPSGYVGKIYSEKGMSQQIIKPSKFRLDSCFTYCDSLVVINTAANKHNLNFKTFMPKDQLYLEYSVTMILSIRHDNLTEVFEKVPFVKKDSSMAYIESNNVFTRYAEPLLVSNIPSLLSQYSIYNIASMRKEINEMLMSEVQKLLADTPYKVVHIGMTNINYPNIITRAKERAAERKEQEAVIKQQREIDLLKIDTELLVAKKKLELELHKAQARALIAKQLMTKDYVTQLKYETLKELASSDNKVFMPMEMISPTMISLQSK
tara:strand:+ start:911 stop:1801 length:891 start_codon:yes stop_codon:yes gene_type:complete